MADSSNDIFNMHKECAECGKCCELTVLSMTIDEAIQIQEYMRDNNVIAVDQGPGICPLRDEDKRCKVYPARSRTCRLHSCKATRNEIATAHPELVGDKGEQLIDLRRAFIYNDFRDPRTMPVEKIIEHYSK